MEVNNLSYTNVDDFIDTRLSQGFTRGEIVEEFKEWLNDY